MDDEAPNPGDPADDDEAPNPGDPADDVEATARAAAAVLTRDGGETIEAVVESARAVEATWGTDHATSRGAVVGPLAVELDRRDLRPRLVDLLVLAADAVGLSLAAPPVPGPPYVVVTSTGPVLRGTAARVRLVIGLRVFEVIRGRPTRYRRRSGGPADVLDVDLRRHP